MPNGQQLPIAPGVYPALSIRQPWAWFVVSGHKPFENRTWWTKYRGPTLIHAPKLLDKMMVEEIIEYYQLGDLDPAQVKLRRGGIIGVADLVDCVDESDSIWFHGPFGFKFANPRPLPFMPCPGRLGFFDVNYQPEKGLW